MSFSYKYWIVPCFVIPSSIVMGMHAYLGSFTRLIADDYCTYYNTETLGVLGTAWFWYRTWTGVFARSILNEILLLVGPYNMEIIVPVVLLIWLVTTAIGAYLLLGTEFPLNERWAISFSISALFIFAILLLSPRLTQSLYWWGGLSAYTLPLILATVYLILFMLITRRVWHTKGMVAWGIMSFLLAFGLGGISESFTPILLVIITSALGIGWLKKQFHWNTIVFWFLGSGLIGLSLALVLMISAPGNAIRQANFPPPPDIDEIFRIATNGYFDFLGSLLADLPKSVGILGFWLGAVFFGAHAKKDGRHRAWLAPVVFLVGVFLAYLCFPPTAYGMSNVPPRRVLIISVYFLAAGLIGSGYLTGKWIASRLSERYKSNLTRGMLVASTLLLSYSSYVTSRELYESRSAYIEFAYLWDQVDAQILEAKAKGEESITIPAMSSWAGLDRPNDNPKFWATRCYSDFYGIQVYGPSYGP